jgi:hypothetical protein
MFPVGTPFAPISNFLTRLLAVNTSFFKLWCLKESDYFSSILYVGAFSNLFYIKCELILYNQIIKES